MTHAKDPQRRLIDEQVRQAKVPPHSIEAEQSVLGSLMLDNNSWEIIVDLLQEKDFYRYEHRLIFRAIATLEQKSQPFDVITLSENLKETGELSNIGGEIYLFELSQNTPSVANIRAYAEIVHERSVLRQIITVASEISEHAFNPKGRDSLSLLDEAEKKVFEIAGRSGRGNGPQLIAEFLATANERVHLLSHDPNALTGLETGFIDFDELTSGLQPADLVIIAGRPSMGKTTFAMNIAEFVAMKNNKPVLIFSMEMPGEALALRTLSSLAKIPLQKLRTGKIADIDWPNITSVVSMLSNRPLFIDDTPALTTTELRSRARRVTKENGQISLIVIDYLQLMQADTRNENRTAEISEISRSLKALAKELNVPVIALSQLNRSLEQRADKRPIMSDLRECVTGDTLVHLADGQQLPIDQLVDKSVEIISISQEQNIATKKIDKIWPAGKKAIIKISLANGSSIKATRDHRLLSANGWLKISQLQLNMLLAIVPPHISLSSIKNYSKNINQETLKLKTWEKIISIEPLGEEVVYDLTVPEHHSWVGNGIVSHNSGAIEQDADLICFIYRDEVYHPETRDKNLAELIIAKQRNGPIGKVSLVFEGQYTRFDNREYRDYESP